MPTIRRVPELYPTIAAAMSAAVAGDTILLKPSATPYAIGGTYPKVVHIKGDTTDPVGNPCIIQPTGLGYGTNQWLPVGAGDIWWEGIKMLPSTYQRVGLNKLTSGKWRFSRCYFARSGVEWHFSFDTFISPAPTADAWFYQCQFEGRAADGTEFIDGWSGRIEAWNCYLPNRPWNGARNTPVISADNSVSVPTAGYGPAYGDWMAPQWMGAAYAIGGKLRLGPGVDPTTSRISLFRRLATGFPEQVAWATTTPSPPDSDSYGTWLFEYLPTDHQYYVSIIPPAGHAPVMHGPYVPSLA